MMETIQFQPITTKSEVVANCDQSIGIQITHRSNAPSPLVGEGWGEGDSEHFTFSLALSHQDRKGLPQLHLPEKHLKMVQEILRAHLPKAEVWAYGSRVNGDYHDTSDLNLVMRQPNDLTCRQANLGNVIEAFSESNLPIFVQLVDWASIPDAFHDEIAAKYVVVQYGIQSNKLSTKSEVVTNCDHLLP